MHPQGPRKEARQERKTPAVLVEVKDATPGTGNKKTNILIWKMQTIAKALKSLFLMTLLEYAYIYFFSYFQRDSSYLIPSYI